MLLGNYSVLSRLPQRFFGGTAATVEVQIRSNFGKLGAIKNFEYQDRGGGVTIDETAIPTGYSQPYAWMMPQYAGQISSKQNIISTAAVSATMKNGRGAMSAAIAGTGNITAFPTRGGVVLTAGLVWEELIASHTTAGSFGNFVQNVLLTVGKFIGLK